MQFSDFLRVIDGQHQILLLNQWPLVDSVATLSVLGLVITWLYAMKSHREALRGNTLAHLPVVILEITETQKILLSNQGNSPAINIKIDSFFLPFFDNLQSFQSDIAQLEFMKVTYLKVGQSYEIETETKSTLPVHDGFAPFNLVYSPIAITFSIRYADLAGGRYVTIVSVSNGTAKLQKPPVRYGLVQKLNYFTRWTKERWLVKVVIPVRQLQYEELYLQNPAARIESYLDLKPRPYLVYFVFFLTSLGKYFRKKQK